MDAGSDPEYTRLGAANWTVRDEAVRAYVAQAVEGVASLVRSTLGPHGMETQVRTRSPEGPPETVHAADAGRILDAIERGDGFSHPVAALLVDGVDTMRRGVGDGTTTAILLAHLLVENGLELVDRGVNPNTVAVGYALAANRAGETLNALSRPVTADDADLLARVAVTAMSGGFDRETAERYAGDVVEAVRGVAAASEWLDTDDVTVVATRHDPDALYRGVVVRRRPKMIDESERSRSEFDWSLRFPDPVRDVTVAVVDGEIDFEATASSFDPPSETGTTGAGAVRSVSELRAYNRELDATVGAAADDLSRMGVDVLVSGPAVPADVRNVLAARGIAVVDEVQFPESDVSRIARSTGASVVSDLADVIPARLGTAGVVTERRVGGEKWTCFDECEGGVFTVVAHCDTATEVDRREHLLATAVDATALAAMDGQLLPGAGAPAMAAAAALRAERHAAPGRLRLPVVAFADALESSVGVLAANCGHDPLDAVPSLRAAHARADGSPVPLGLDAATGDPVDAWAAGVVEPRRVFSQATETARTVGEQLLTVDAALFPNVDLGAVVPATEHD